MLMAELPQEEQYWTAFASSSLNFQYDFVRKFLSSIIKTSRFLLLNIGLSK